MADEPQEDRRTVRERRAQHAREQARREAPARLARKAVVPAILVLLIAAIAAGFWWESKKNDNCPGHWHATFDVYVQEDANATAQRMSFRHPAFDLNGQTPYRAHMHQGDNKNQFHFEQGGQCVGVEEAFGYVDVELNANSIEFEGLHASIGQAGKHRESGNLTLRAFVEHVSDREKDSFGRTTNATLEWREESVRSILGYQLRDGERLLILFGDYSDAEIASYQAAMALPDSGRPPGR